MGALSHSLIFPVYKAPTERDGPKGSWVYRANRFVDFPLHYFATFTHYMPDRCAGYHPAYVSNILKDRALARYPAVSIIQAVSNPKRRKPRAIALPEQFKHKRRGVIPDASFFVPKTADYSAFRPLYPVAITNFSELSARLLGGFTCMVFLKFFFSISNIWSSAPPAKTLAINVPPSSSTSSAK